MKTKTIQLASSYDDNTDQYVEVCKHISIQGRTIPKGSMIWDLCTSRSTIKIKSSACHKCQSKIDILT